MALPNIHIGTMAGKLNGVMPRRRQRLVDLVDVDAGRRLLAEAALEQLRDAARELQVLEAASELAQGIGRDLAVLGREQGGDVAAMVLHEVPDAEHDFGPLRQRGRPPARKRGLRGGDGAVHLVGRGEVHPLRLGACRGIEDGAPAAGGTGDGVAPDPVADGRERGCGSGTRGIGELGHRSDLCGTLGTLVAVTLPRSAPRRGGSGDRAGRIRSGVASRSGQAAPVPLRSAEVAGIRPRAAGRQPP
jgi:hypothetical protein